MQSEWNRRRRVREQLLARWRADPARQLLFGVVVVAVTAYGCFRFSPVLRGELVSATAPVDLAYYALVLLSLGVVGSRPSHWSGAWGVMRLLGACVVGVDIIVGAGVLAGWLSSVPALAFLLTAIAMAVVYLGRLFLATSSK